MDGEEEKLGKMELEDMVFEEIFWRGFNSVCFVW